MPKKIKFNKVLFELKPSEWDAGMIFLDVINKQ